jgi:hypothetical protein
MRLSNNFNLIAMLSTLSSEANSFFLHRDCHLLHPRLNQKQLFLRMPTDKLTIQNRTLTVTHTELNCKQTHSICLLALEKMSFSSSFSHSDTPSTKVFLRPRSNNKPHVTCGNVEMQMYCDRFVSAAKWCEEHLATRVESQQIAGQSLLSRLQYSDASVSSARNVKFLWWVDLWYSQD